MLRQRQRHASALARYRFDHHPRADACGPLAHDAHADMRLAARIARRVEALTVVAHLEAPRRSLLHLKPQFTRASMFAHVRERFLQHMQDLHLDIGVERQAMTLHRQMRSQSRLMLELAQRRS